MPDNSNSGLTNGVSLGRGCLFNQPMAEEGSVLETCLTKIILFSISLHILYILAVKVQLIFEQMNVITIIQNKIYTAKILDYIRI